MLLCDRYLTLFYSRKRRKATKKEEKKMLDNWGFLWYYNLRDGAQHLR